MQFSILGKSVQFLWNPIKLVWCDDKGGREKADIPRGSSQPSRPTTCEIDNAQVPSLLPKQESESALKKSSNLILSVWGNRIHPHKVVHRSTRGRLRRFVNAVRASSLGHLVGVWNPWLWCDLEDRMMPLRGATLYLGGLHQKIISKDDHQEAFCIKMYPVPKQVHIWILRHVPTPNSYSNMYPIPQGVLASGTGHIFLHEPPNGNLPPSVASSWS